MKALPKIFGVALIILSCFAARAQSDNIDELTSKALDDSSLKVRLQAIFMLSNMGDDKRAIDALIKLTRDGEYAVRGASAIALGKIGDTTAIPDLFEMAKDSDKFVRAQSVKALKQIVEKEQAISEVLAYVRQSDDRVRSQAIEILGGIKNPAAIRAVIQALGDRDEGVAQTAEEAILRREKDEVINILLQAMYDKTPGIRLRVIKILGKVQDQRAINVLSGVLASDIPKTEQDAAIEALTSMHDMISLATTLSSISTSPDKNTRNRMLYLLEAKAGEPESKEAVYTALRSVLLNDKDPYLRGRAAQTLARLGADRFIPDMEDALKKPENAEAKKMIEESINALKQKKSATPQK